jgi:hypothetical protein
MARYKDSTNLFGASFGESTQGELTCGICGKTYNKGADDLDENGDEKDYDDYESVGHTEFAGITICENCFEAVEDEILHRMTDILIWYRMVLEERKKETADDETVLSKIEALDEK